MTLQTLVSTMHQTNNELINKMNIQSNAVVINQCDLNTIEEFSNGKYSVKWINSAERGLSVSRNKALDNANGAICLIADDDLIYVRDYDKIIQEQFQLYPKADIIAFQVEGIERKFKNYYPKPRSINFLSSMKISSVEIAFRLEKVKEKNIRFNTLFGSGAKYYMGEESIFLIDCLRAGLVIQYVPIKIADLHLGESSWFVGYNSSYFINKGAAFTAMSAKQSIPLILQFALRKFKLYKNNLSLADVIKLMFSGRRMYLDEIKRGSK